MKKFTAVITAAVLAAAVFTACGKKDITAYDIEGTWENVYEGSVTTSTSIYTFKTDMTYTHSYTSSSDVVSIGTDDEEKYSLSGTTITIERDSDSVSYGVSFDGDDMIFTSESGTELIFKRK